MEKSFDPRFSFSGSFVASPPATDQSNLNFAHSMKIIAKKCKLGQFLKSSKFSQFDFKSDLRSWGLAFREKHFRDHDVSR